MLTLAKIQAAFARLDHADAKANRDGDPTSPLLWLLDNFQGIRVRAAQLRELAQSLLLAGRHFAEPNPTCTPGGCALPRAVVTAAVSAEAASPMDRVSLNCTPCSVTVNTIGWGL